MADDDEGWGQGWAAVVFHYQVISLELPEDVSVSLHHLEGVTEHGNEEVEQQDIGDKKEDNQEQNDQPIGIAVGTGWPLAQENFL